MNRFKEYDLLELADMEKLLLYLAFYASLADRKLIAKYFEILSIKIACNFDEELAFKKEFMEKPEDIIKSIYNKYNLDSAILNREYNRLNQILINKNIKFISVLDDKYPELLRKISGYPLGLFYKGDISLISKPCVSIVGSRKATFDASKMCDMIAKHLINANVSVISGLAFGVDSYIHKACLKYGVKTVSVLPSCVDNPIPVRNRKIASDILKSGGLLISENPPNFNVRPESYVERNRIISGISDRTLVVEAAIKSGSMTTAKFAIEQNRELYAMVGSISNPVAKGTNYLISQGAKPLVYASDFYSIELENVEDVDKEKELPNSEILDYIKDKGMVEIDEIIANLSLSEVEVISKITEYEIFGYIRRQLNYVEIA